MNNTKQDSAVDRIDLLPTWPVDIIYHPTSYEQRCGLSFALALVGLIGITSYPSIVTITGSLP
jgi:hypothetical protein